MPSRTGIPRAVVAGLILAVALDTCVQIFWKLAVLGIADGAPLAVVAAGALHSRYFYLAMLCFVAQFANWMSVLAHADLSFAQPITALSYITVLSASRILLREEIPPLRMLGVSLILLGVFFISRTPHRTAASGDGGRGA